MFQATLICSIQTVFVVKQELAQINKVSARNLTSKSFYLNTLGVNEKAKK